MTISDQEFLASFEKARVTGLFYYPIKSCRGIAMPEAELDECGIKHDRELMLVETATREFLTQRELPRMALIRPEIQGDLLHVEAPGMPPLEIRFGGVGSGYTATIWKDSPQVVDQGEEAARWFGEFLKYDCRLVKMAPAYTRQVNQHYALAESDQVNFADGFPLLIISEESLADLNGRLDEALPMNRFRPNLVIAGSGIPFNEDRLKRFKAGEVTFSVVKPCARCPITTTDQETTIVGKEPLRTLATYRRGWNNSVMFGQNLIHENLGTLRVGDLVIPLKLKKRPAED